MSGEIYINPDGSFPTNSGGEPVAVDELAFRDVCCRWRGVLAYKVSGECADGEWDSKEWVRDTDVEFTTVPVGLCEDVSPSLVFSGLVCGDEYAGLSRQWVEDEEHVDGGYWEPTGATCLVYGPVQAWDTAKTIANSECEDYAPTLLDMPIAGQLSVRWWERMYGLGGMNPSWSDWYLLSEEEHWEDYYECEDPSDRPLCPYVTYEIQIIDEEQRIDVDAGFEVGYSVPVCYGETPSTDDADIGTTSGALDESLVLDSGTWPMDKQEELDYYNENCGEAFGS